MTIEEIPLNKGEDWKIGDLVTVDPLAGFPKSVSTTRVYEITKRPGRANEVNYTAEPADGVGRGVRGPAYCFKRYDGPRPEQKVGCPPPSTVVRLAGKDGLFVVTKVDPDGQTGTVLHLNGEGKGYRRVQGAHMTKVEVQETGVADPDLAEIELAAQEAADAANGDSNDREIARLQEVLDLALSKLGLTMPDPTDEFDENDR